MPFLALLGFLKGPLGKLAIIGAIIAAAAGYHFFTLHSVESKLNNTIAENSVLKQDVATAEANEAQLNGAITSLNSTVEILETQRRVDQQKIDKLTNEYSISRKQVGKLRQILSKHDLAYLALQKPGLIENRINRGTDDVGKDIQEITTYEQDTTD